MAARGGARFTSDEELKSLSFADVVRRLRWCENERMRLITEHGNALKDLKHQLLAKTNENPTMKAENQKLMSENQELRDLCCFLDDDRQKGRKVSNEWQRFGQYTTNVMRNGVSTYQDKLRELEERQEKVLQENLELRELCFLLDQERTGNKSTLLSLSSNGDSQDKGEGKQLVNGPSSLSKDGHILREGSSTVTWGNGGDFSLAPNSDQSNHVGFMEDPVRAFDEKKQFSQPEARRNGPISEEKIDGPTQNHVSSASNSVHPRNSSRGYSTSIENGNVAPSSPKAMVNALKVLEVHDMLEATPNNHMENDHMNTNEKAIVREMCNVVWRKLGDNPANQNGNGSNNGSSNSSGNTGSNQSQQRPPAPPRYAGSAPVPRPPGYTTPTFSGGSTSSLERKEL